MSDTSVDRNKFPKYCFLKHHDKLNSFHFKLEGFLYRRGLIIGSIILFISVRLSYKRHFTVSRGGGSV